MLKIRDDVDLKELEKFGFKLDCTNKVYELGDYWVGVDCIAVHIDNRKIYFTFHYDDLENVLFDLITAGLVEKVVE